MMFTQAVLIATAIACAGTTAVAAESAAVASAEFRLSVGNPDAYRFAGGDAYIPAPTPAKRSTIAAQLADKPFAAQIAIAARQAALDPALVHALIYVESRYNPAARSPKGAVGLMQLLPGTALRYGVADPARATEANLRAGTRYLGDLMTLFDGRVDLALAAYNAGENAVLRHGLRIPPYRETREYVPAVLARYRELKDPDPPPTRHRVSVVYLPGTRLDPDLLR